MKYLEIWENNQRKLSFESSSFFQPMFKTQFISGKSTDSKGGSLDPSCDYEVTEVHHTISVVSNEPSTTTRIDVVKSDPPPNYNRTILSPDQ